MWVRNSEKYSFQKPSTLLALPDFFVLQVPSFLFPLLLSGLAGVLFLFYHLLFPSPICNWWRKQKDWASIFTRDVRSLLGFCRLFSGGFGTPKKLHFQTRTWASGFQELGLCWCSLDILRRLSDKIGKANKFVFEYGGWDYFLYLWLRY